MNAVNGNPYRTPESDIGSVELGQGVNNFERFSAWAVFGLSIVTLGIYPLYWLYTRSQTLNSFHHNKVSPTLLGVFVVLIVASFLTSLLDTGEGTMVMVGAVVNLAYTIVYLMVLFTLRNRLSEIVMDDVSGVVTFFGSAIYLQYEINKCIDRQGKIGAREQ